MAGFDNRYDFENYPRESLDIPVSRRALLSALAVNLAAQSKEINGEPVFKSSQVGILPDEEFAILKPVVIKGCQISIQDDFVCAKPCSAFDFIPLFPMDAPALAAFNQFNGMTTVAEISQALAEKTGWDVGRSFAYTRGLFLHLVMESVCCPG